MIPYSRQSIDQNDIRAAMKVVGSDYLTQGPAVLRFEQALARYCGARYAVAVSSGTAALHLAYLAAGFTEETEVITTPNTFVATTNMLLVVGAKPVFCDIRLDTYNLDEKKIEKLVTKKTRAIVPVHFAGQPCEMDKIFNIAERHKLLVIEDACHALGAKYKGRKIGALKSDLMVFSFHAVKAITTGEGGAILTNSKKYYDKLVLLRSHGIYKDKHGKNVMIELGYNYRLTDIQAALGFSQLKKLDKFLKARNQIVKWYAEELGDFEDLILPWGLSDNYSGWHLFVIRLKNPKLRDKLWQHLVNKGIGANFHYPAVYSHPYYRRHGFAKLSLQNEESYHKSCLSLPCYPSMERTQVEYICRTIRNFFEKHAKIH